MCAASEFVITEIRTKLIKAKHLQVAGVGVEQHSAKCVIDGFLYHSNHKQATKRKHAAVLQRAHFLRSAEKNEAF